MHIKDAYKKSLSKIYHHFHGYLRFNVNSYVHFLLYKRRFSRHFSPQKVVAKCLDHRIYQLVFLDLFFSNLGVVS